MRELTNDEKAVVWLLFYAFWVTAFVAVRDLTGFSEEKIIWALFAIGLLIVVVTALKIFGLEPPKKEKTANESS